MSPTGRTIRLAAALPMTVPGDVEANLATTLDMMTDAASRGAHLVAFSEGSLTGYDMQDRGIAAAISVDDPALDRVAEAAQRLDIAAVVGFYEQADDGLYNAAMACLPDGQRVHQRKHAIIDHERSATAVRPGPRQRAQFTVSGFRFSIVICADTGVRGLFDEIAAAGSDGVICITAGCARENWGFHQSELADADRRAAYLERARLVCFPTFQVDVAARTGMAVLACNQQGWDPGTGYFHPGHAFVIDGSAEILAMIPGRFVFEQLKPELIVADIAR